MKTSCLASHANFTNVALTVRHLVADLLWVSQKKQNTKMTGSLRTICCLSPSYPVFPAQWLHWEILQSWPHGSTPAHASVGRTATGRHSSRSPPVTHWLITWTGASETACKQERSRNDRNCCDPIQTSNASTEDMLFVPSSPHTISVCVENSLSDPAGHFSHRGAMTLLLIFLTMQPRVR